MNIRKILLMLSIFVLLFSVSASAKTLELTIWSTDVNVLDKGVVTKSQVEAPLFTENDRTMVPVRIIAENFGCEVTWDEAEEAVGIIKGDTKITLWLGKNVAKINDKETTLDVAPMETGGRTFVPVRFISETLGYYVNYVSITEQVLICDNPDIMTVNGNKVPYAVYEFVMAMNSAGYKYNDEEYDFLSAAAYTSLEELYSNSSVAKAQGLTITNGAKEKYLRDMNDILASNRALYNSSLKGAFVLYIEECIYSEAITNKIVAEITPTEEAIAEKYNNSYKAAKYIYMSQNTKNAKNQLQVAYNTLKQNPNSFDTVMMDKTEDEFFNDYPNGYPYTEGDHDEAFLKALGELEVGEISNVIEIEGDGFYIIKRLPLPELNEEFRELTESILFSENYEKAMESYFGNIGKAEKHISETDALKLFGGKK